MSQEVFKTPRVKRSNNRNEIKSWPPKKRRRTREDFFEFCNIVLEYTGYEGMKAEDLRSRNNTSPLDSGGSTAESFTSESTSSSFTEHDADKFEEEPLLRPSKDQTGRSSDDDSESITCFCMKPFGGRPMIECSECYTWIHLSCAKIRKTNIPEEFICPTCKDSKLTKRKSGRARSERKVVSA